MLIPTSMNGPTQHPSPSHSDPVQWMLLAREAQFRPAELAKRFCVTSHHLNRVALRRFGVNLSVWLRVTQLNHAILLLGQTRSVKQSAHLGGYRRVSTFIDHFHHFHGLPPGQHLREMRRREKEFWDERMPA